MPLHEVLAETERREQMVRYAEISSQIRCSCGGERTWEMGEFGPYVFCVDCGAGAPDR